LCENSTGNYAAVCSRRMPLIWVFQQDNDPKYTSNFARVLWVIILLKKWFQDRIKEWLAQSPDLNLIENLYCDVKKVVASCKPEIIINFGQRCNMVVEILIPFYRYRTLGAVERYLVDSMKRRCAAVKFNKGHD